VVWLKPDPFLESFKNTRWFKLFETGITWPNHEHVRHAFAGWLCREYNSRFMLKERLNQKKKIGEEFRVSSFMKGTDFSSSDILVESNSGNSRSTLFMKMFFWMAREVLPFDNSLGLMFALVLGSLLSLLTDMLCFVLFIF
jgi:hypothetical protein